MSRIFKILLIETLCYFPIDQKLNLGTLVSHFPNPRVTFSMGSYLFQNTR